MPQIRNARLMRIGHSTCVIIPKEVVDGFGWLNGQDVRMNVDDNGVYIPTKGSRLVNAVCKRCGITLQKYERAPTECQNNIISHRWIERSK